MTEIKMKDKVVICTGASNGIGLATANKLLEADANVLGVDLAACPSHLASSKKFKYLKINLTEPNAAETVVSACQEYFGGRIDSLLNVAGVVDTFGSVDSLEDEIWDRVIAINLTAPVKLMRATVKVMLKQEGGGSIVNVSSKAGVSGAVSGVSYASSKHGLIGATQNVAWRFRQNRIRCNAVCPGAVGDTKIMESIDPSKFDHEGLKHMQQAITPIDSDERVEASQVADTIIYLASDASLAMNGAVVAVDKAWSTV